jgi:hypothetical protein
VEIGVGRSLALAQPPTLVIGVDPAMRGAPLSFPIATEAHLYAETSDDFFAEKRLGNLLRGRRPVLGWASSIAYTRSSTPSASDFINLELHSGPPRGSNLPANRGFPEAEA